MPDLRVATQRRVVVRRARRRHVAQRAGEARSVAPRNERERIVAAAKRLRDEGIAEPIVLGDVGSSDRLDAYAALYRRKLAEWHAAYPIKPDTRLWQPERTENITLFERKAVA